MTYIDSCGVIMFADRDDVLRGGCGIGKGRIDSILRRGSFRIPMVALGESFHMIRQKNLGRYSEPLDELNRLLDSGFLEVGFIHDPAATFSLARVISESGEDDRDTISPMDSLIVASAVTDPECRTLFTSDLKLMLNSNVLDEIVEWRKSKGYPEVEIRDICELVGGRRRR